MRRVGRVQWVLSTEPCENSETPRFRSLGGGPIVVSARSERSEVSKLAALRGAPEFSHSLDSLPTFVFAR